MGKIVAEKIIVAVLVITSFILGGISLGVVMEERQERLAVKLDKCERQLNQAMEGFRCDRE